MGTVEQILDRWTLRAMCARCGIALPEREGRKFHSPFRPDNNPSCEIYKEKIMDRSSGESYDSIRVFAETKGLTNSESVKQLAKEGSGSNVNVYNCRQDRNNCSQNRTTTTVVTAAKVEPLILPPTITSRALCAELAELRKLPTQAAEAANLSLGTVRFGRVCGNLCWIITDGNHIAEARRMDGKLFPAFGNLGERKAHTIKGSCKAWPIGLNPQHYVPPYSPIVLGEGGPDYIALCAIALETKPEFLPVVMLGSSLGIHKDALAAFTLRAVTILAHPDDSGREAAIKWARQLAPVAKSVRVVQLAEGDVNDHVSKIGARAFSQEVLK